MIPQDPHNASARGAQWLASVLAGLRPWALGLGVVAGGVYLVLVGVGGDDGVALEQPGVVAIALLGLYAALAACAGGRGSRGDAAFVAVALAAALVYWHVALIWAAVAAGVVASAVSALGQWPRRDWNPHQRQAEVRELCERHLKPFVMP